MLKGKNVISHNHEAPNLTHRTTRIPKGKKDHLYHKNWELQFENTKESNFIWLKNILEMELKTLDKR